MTTVFAHRGYCAAYPENTMLSFRMTVDRTTDGNPIPPQPEHIEFIRDKPQVTNIEPKNSA
jgi:hypothetical protein